MKKEERIARRMSGNVTVIGHWVKDSDPAGFYKHFTRASRVAGFQCMHPCVFLLVCSSSSSMVSMFYQIKSNSFNFDYHLTNNSSCLINISHVIIFNLKSFATISNSLYVN
jgi:hypothetical protein